MFRRTLTTAGVPAVVAAVLLMAAPAWAWPHGGGGGGHGGGFRGGSPHVGGFRPGGSHLGGFRSGTFHPGGIRTNRFHRGGSFPGYPYGYYPYPSSSYSPSYDSGYGSGPDLEDSGSYETAPPSGPGGDQAPEPPSTVSPDTASAQTDTTAHITVRVPANAKVWFDRWITTATGPVRRFNTTPLAPGQYTYEVRARWTENGRDITQTQPVVFSPGAHTTADFPIQSRARVLPRSP